MSRSLKKLSVFPPLAWLVLLVASALLLACTDDTPSRPRAVVIGIDSADWRLIDPLIEAGRMPNLAALRERGTSGPIRTLADFPLSPVIWTSVATGKTPAKHGITWFLVDQSDGSRVPVRSHNRKVKALWNILGEAGIRTATLGWWATYPAEDVADGLMVASNPNFPPALAQLADLRRDDGDLAGCVQLYQQALSLRAAAPSRHLGLGDCLQRSGRYDEAEQAFVRALQLDPDSFAAIYNLGVVAFQMGREEEALSRYEQAIALDPQHPLVAATFNNLGTVYLDRGDIERAMSSWEQAVAQSPAQFEARFNLAAQYLERGELERAIPLLEGAARLSPNHEFVHTRLARAYLETGRADDAYRALMLVRRLYPDNWFAPLGLAVLYAATEQPEQARPLLTEALQLGGEVSRAAAAGYPALAPLLAESPEAAAP